MKQYRRMQARLKNTFKNEGFEVFEEHVNVIATKLSLVSISLRDPIAAPIIFERLNSRGEKITTADLVRNEIFARDASDPAKAKMVFENYWEPFQKKYDKRKLGVETLLFPYGLTFDSNITKAELFQKLRTRWASLENTTDIISELDIFSDTLFALELGELSDDIPKELRASLLRMHQANSPSSIYPFVFMAIEAVKQETQQASDIAEALSTIESFLVRRAVCGIEPTGLHAVFKGMWQEILANSTFEKRVSGDAVKFQIAKRTTVAWPNNDRFKEALLKDALYKRRICKFVVSQREIASKGETPADDFWIEHVLPNKFHAANWSKDFTTEEHTELKDTFGNLIPLTSEMNQSESQNQYDKKKVAFAKSMFASTRDFAEEHTEWTPASLRKRSDILAQWALSRWPHHL